jgi:hypothetical protein
MGHTYGQLYSECLSLYKARHLLIVYYIMASSKQLIVGNTNEEINQLISAANSSIRKYTCHYNSSEEMFLKFDKSLTVPAMPIHHDVRDSRAGREYSKSIVEVVRGVMESLPGFLNGMKYYFDPRDVHRPTFYQLYKIQHMNYLYQLKFDLTFHPSHHRVLTQGSNDVSPKFETNRLIIEADFIPIVQIDKVDGFPSLIIEESITDTWIGETGRGYYLQGIWLDREITKFFSKLFLQPGQRMYPFYPIHCKYQAICQSLNVFSPEARKKRLAAHHNIRRFILKYLDNIEAALRNNEFSEDLDAFSMIRQKVPAPLINVWKDVSVKAYLNNDDIREYLVEDSLF